MRLSFDPATAAWQTGTGAPGLVGQYFNSNDLSGSPVATRVDTELNFVGNGLTPAFTASNVPVSNPSSFSGIWTGKVQPTITGYQVFKVSSGGNVRLFVNNQLIIDDTSPVATPDTPISAAPPIIPVSGKIYLQAAPRRYAPGRQTFCCADQCNPSVGLHGSWSEPWNCHPR